MAIEVRLDMMLAKRKMPLKPAISKEFGLPHWRLSVKRYSVNRAISWNISRNRNIARMNSNACSIRLLLISFNFVIVVVIVVVVDIDF
jgi:hypothetical protein